MGGKRRPWHGQRPERYEVKRRTDDGREFTMGRSFRTLSGVKKYVKRWRRAGHVMAIRAVYHVTIEDYDGR